MESNNRRYPDYPELLRPQDVAVILGIGRSSVYNLLRAGKIRHLRVGRKMLIPQAAIGEFLATAA